MSDPIAAIVSVCPYASTTLPYRLLRLGQWPIGVAMLVLARGTTFAQRGLIKVPEGISIYTGSRLAGQFSVLPVFESTPPPVNTPRWSDCSRISLVFVALAGYEISLRALGKTSSTYNTPIGTPHHPDQRHARQLTLKPRPHRPKNIGIWLSNFGHPSRKRVDGWKHRICRIWRRNLFLGVVMRRCGRLISMVVKSPSSPTACISASTLTRCAW